LYSGATTPAGRVCEAGLESLPGCLTPVIPDNLSVPLMNTGLDERAKESELCISWQMHEYSIAILFIIFPNYRP
jgi:hypothetical protein